MEIIPNMNSALKTFPTQLLACLLSLSLVGCSTSRSQNVWHDLGSERRPEIKQPAGAQSLRWGAETEGPEVADPVIAPGFQLSLQSLEDSKLNGDFQVAFDGSLTVPYDVTINTTGLTVSQAEKKLTELYRPFFKTPSAIKLRVRERHYWVDVQGLVQKPGRFLVDRTTSLDQLISLAGGLSMNEDNVPHYVQIQKGSKSLVIDLAEYLNQGQGRGQIAGWYGGDVLIFQREAGDIETRGAAGFHLPIYMLGEVRKPGEYSAKTGHDFTDFLAQANGFTQDADLGRIEVIRRRHNRLDVYEFSWNDLAQAPTPVEGDVIIVHADHDTKIERRIGIAAVVVSALASVATAYVVYDHDK